MILQDFWQPLPAQLKIIIGVAIFVNFGWFILQAAIFLWNIIAINGLNLLNGCLTGTASVCVPQMNGIMIFGINFADYWVIMLIMFGTGLALVAHKWYQITLHN